MARLLERITRRGNSSEEAQQIISQFTGQTEKLRVELEGTPAWFLASPLLRSGAVVITTPRTHQKLIVSGNWIRIRVSEKERKDLRLEISAAKHGGSAHMALTPDQIAVLCKLPGAAVVPSLRKADRISTGQYRDLLLRVSSPSGMYPVVNLSKNGVKIRLADEKQKELFPLGHYLRRGAIRLGKKAAVSLLDIIPRCHYEDAVGLEMVVDPKGSSRRVLDMFLEHVEQKELQAMATAAPAQKPAPAEDAAPA